MTQEQKRPPMTDADGLRLVDAAARLALVMVPGTVLSNAIHPQLATIWVCLAMVVFCSFLCAGSWLWMIVQGGKALARTHSEMMDLVGKNVGLARLPGESNETFGRRVSSEIAKYAIVHETMQSMERDLAKTLNTQNPNERETP